jgi:ATP-dependent RNA helicase DeaD
MDQYRQTYDVPALDIAAALACMVQKDKPLQLVEEKRQTQEKQNTRKKGPDKEYSVKSDREKEKKRKNTKERENTKGKERSNKREKKTKSSEKTKQAFSAPETGMERFRIEVGHAHGIRPGDIVGAVSNEAGLESKHIGEININDSFSTVDLPEGMPDDVFNLLKKVRVCQHPMKITRVAQE